MTDLDRLLAMRASELGTMAESWLAEGAKAVEIWGPTGLAARWAPGLELGGDSDDLTTRRRRRSPARFPRSGGAYVPIVAGETELGLLRLVGMRPSMTRRRLLMDAAAIASLVQSERDLDDMTKSLVDSQDHLLGIVSMFEAAQLDPTGLRTGLVSRARHLFGGGPVVLLTLAKGSWHVDADPVTEGPGLRSILAGRTPSVEELAQELQRDWTVSSAPEHISVPLLLLVPRDASEHAWSPTMRLAAATAELCATLIGQAARREEVLERERLERQMAFAGEVQRHLLPQPGARPRGLRLATRYQPADAVGGDLLCVRSTGAQTLLALGDVSGKGVPAALLMSAARALFESHARVTSEPAELLARLTHDLSNDLDRNAAFLTFCVARHDADSGELRIANAGHAPVLLRSASGVELLEPIDPPIGVLDDPSFGQVSLQMAAGDTLLMASDGISEREDPDGRQFGIERIAQTMVTGDGSPRRIADRLIGAARRFAAGRPRGDDESLLIVQARSGVAA